MIGLGPVWHDHGNRFGCVTAWVLGAVCKAPHACVAPPTQLAWANPIQDAREVLLCALLQARSH